MGKFLLIPLLVALVAASIELPDQEASTSNNYSIMFTTANHNFAISLYKKLLNDQVPNLVVSPYSLSTALTMLYAGARGNTSQEIRTALSYEHIPDTQLFDIFHNTTDSFKRTTSSVLNIANSIWSLQSFNVSQEYKNRLVHYFQAEEHAINLTTGLNDINSWVANRTNNKIPQLLSDLPNNCLMLLLSAIYFKGHWKTSFDTQLSALDSFYGNRTVQTTFMNIEDSFGYYDCPVFNSKLLELPFKGENITMIFILPRSLEDLETRTLTPGNLFQCIRNLRQENVIVKLPKFEIKSSFNLKSSLRALGINNIFGNANFDGISQLAGLRVSEVIQKATLTVSEEGAEASAASAVIVADSLGPVPKEFIANRPFLYLLKHKPTDTILFMGRYTQPSL